MGLQVTLLGGLEARTERGDIIRFPTRKSTALLAVLATEPTVTYPRERLATLLWPDSGESQARGNLRQTLAQLREALATANVPGITASGDGLRMDPAGIEVDAAEFDKAVAEGSPKALERTAALYGGDFLDGFSIPEEPFEDWVLIERTQRRNRAVKALGKLLDHYRGG